jgi:putative oxidoreductase
MFDLTSVTALGALRVVCGLFFIPHAVGKFTARDAAFGFFRAAGFSPAPLYAYFAMSVEIVLAILLVSGYQVKIAAWVACIHLLVATAAVLKVQKKWLWHIGGCEYPFFWALCCAIVGVYY